MGFELTTTEFRSDALTNWAIRPWVKLVLLANFLQLLQFHRLLRIRFHFGYCLRQSPHLFYLFKDRMCQSQQAKLKADLVWKQLYIYISTPVSTYLSIYHLRWNFIKEINKLNLQNKGKIRLLMTPENRYYWCKGSCRNFKIDSLNICRTKFPDTKKSLNG